jgi:hypothetical protein
MDPRTADDLQCDASFAAELELSNLISRGI